MTKRALALLFVATSTAPVSGDAQGLAFAGRAGTLGLGGEAAIALTEPVVLRGGIGFTPFEPTMTFGGLDVALDLPTVYNVGIDFYLNGAFRIGGGMLFRAGDPEVRGEFTESQEIGGTTFTPQEIGTLHGVLDAKDRATYVLIGFGRHTAAGIGLFLDLGVAFVGDPSVRLSASGGTLSDDPATISALEQEAMEFEEDMQGYLKLWPILSIGIRLGAN
jgi:hypothetical protein